MADQPEQMMFETDEQLARRLVQVENGLAHLEVAIPSLRREVGRVRELAFPSIIVPGEPAV